MGQSQSAREPGEDPLPYHPSAVGFSLTSGPIKDLEDDQKRSRFGPIRTRIRNKKPKADSDIDRAEEQCHPAVFIAATPTRDGGANYRGRQAHPSLAARIGLTPTKLGVGSTPSAIIFQFADQAIRILSLTEDGKVIANAKCIRGSRSLPSMLDKSTRRIWARQSGSLAQEPAGSILDSIKASDRPASPSVDQQDPVSFHGDLLLQSSSKVKRKPVPLLEDLNDDHECSDSAQTSPVEVGKYQRTLWTAPVEETIVSSKRTGIASRRNSTTTEALHSHVDQLRSGPSYHVDRDASDLLFASQPIAFPVSEISVGKSSRASGFIEKVKERVRRTSGARLLSLPPRSNRRKEIASVTRAGSIGTDAALAEEVPPFIQSGVAIEAEEQKVVRQSDRFTTPIILIGRDGGLSPLGANEVYEKNTSQYSTLTPISAHSTPEHPYTASPIPPPRRSRKTKVASSNGNAASAAPSHLPDTIGFAAELYRVSSIGIDRKPSASRRGERIDRNSSINDDASSNDKLTDASDGYHKSSIHPWEADRTAFSFVPPSNEEEQTTGLSPFSTKQRAVTHARSREGLSALSADETARRKSRRRRGRAARRSQPFGHDYRDEQVAPALAKRLQIESAQGARVITCAVPPLEEAVPSKSTICSTYKVSNDNKRQPCTTLSRTFKTRSGYSCDDIKAWQASLCVAALPLTLVE